MPLWRRAVRCHPAREGGPKDRMRGLKIHPEAIYKNTEEEFYND